MPKSPDQENFPVTEGVVKESKEIPTEKVLVVEDREENRNAAAKFFASAGIECTFATDYTEALPLLRSGNFNRVVSDLLYPEKTGSNSWEKGKQVLYQIIKNYQKYTVEQEKERAKEDRNEAPERPEFTQEDFDRLIQATGKVKADFDQKLQDDKEFQERVSYYDDEGEYLMQNGFYDYIDEKKPDSDEINAIDQKVNLCFPRGYKSHVILGAYSLVSQDESLQPLGWDVAQLAKEQNAKSIIFTGAAHKGYGTGAVNMLTMSMGDSSEHGGKWSEISDNKYSDPVTENVEVVIGDKTSPAMWQKATQFLITQKQSN
jgi:CheY-like chemotaxis protein